MSSYRIYFFVVYNVLYLFYIHVFFTFYVNRQLFLGTSNYDDADNTVLGDFQNMLGNFYSVVVKFFW